ncbi:hypothetical protein BDE27_0874 [Xenorhabdus ehlersii]|uniref:Uncharacterized protein n=1 Tax=Xenorhabdus ehlersii TaxID=290111 RepID=A0A2D0IXJ4_9GAMM|nr:hypothetical protein Xehl_00310 [Xenorhabdus ehlersii]RKE93164.1 hypothetical protein BDE27_0874 [Xenorhabdus ehlersii]
MIRISKDFKNGNHFTNYFGGRQRNIAVEKRPGTEMGEVAILNRCIIKILIATEAITLLALFSVPENELPVDFIIFVY